VSKARFGREEEERTLASEDWAIRRAFALTLRNLRYQTGISQEILALNAGINRGYMSGLEQGRHAPTLVMLCRLLPYLQVSFTEFAVEFERCLPLARRKSRV
jgi:transcriptional regulator with XRE-family HTH domain